MKYYIFILVTFLFISCTKEESRHYEAYLINNSLHNIEFRPYYGGIVPTANIFRLAPNDTLQIADGNDRGKNGYGFNPKYYAGADSIVAIFDNLYSIVHYGIAPAVLNPKHYLYSSLKNIANTDGYRVVITDYSKYDSRYVYWKTFTEEDYLDAK